ncbi:TolC family protein [Marinoscillum luteum]|uniref:TolC family protein n=1 Tax=Marinoscillum luteum TaxID=861051 RepID=A0ABW7N7Y5_9BACT
MIKGLFILIGMISFIQDPHLVMDEETVVSIALEKNFDLILESYQVVLAENDNTMGNAGMLPTIDLSGEARQSIQNTEQQFFSGDTQSRTAAKTTNYNAGVNMAWTLFDGLKMFATKERLEEIQKTNEYAFRAQVQNVLSDVMKAFYNTALEQERLALLQSTLALSEERVGISKEKYEVGKASKLEYLQAQVDYNTDQSALVRQQEVIARSKLALLQLLGLDTSDSLSLQYNYELNGLLALPELEETALQQNPDLQYLQSQREVAVLTTRERERELYPSLDFNLGYNYSNLKAEAGFLQSNRTNGVNYGLSATMTLFDGLNQQRAIQNSRIQSEYAMTAFEQAKMQLLTAIRSGFLTLKNSLTLVALEEQNLEVAKENVEIALERYRIGKSNPLEIREAQNNAVNAQIRHLEALNSAKIAEIELKRLSGQIIN